MVEPLQFDWSIRLRSLARCGCRKRELEHSAEKVFYANGAHPTGRNSECQILPDLTRSLQWKTPTLGKLPLQWFVSVVLPIGPFDPAGK